MPLAKVSTQPVYTSVPRFAAMVGLSPRLCWDLVWGNQIPSIRIGRRVLVPVERGTRALEKLDRKPLHVVASPSPGKQATRLSPRNS